MPLFYKKTGFFFDAMLWAS